MYSINGIVLASLKPRREGEFFGKFSDCRSCSTLINFQLDFTIELTTFSGDLDKLSEELASIFNPTHVNLTWIPNSNDICVSSIAKYFSDAGRNVKLCKNKISSRPEFGLKFPDLSQEDDEARLLEISEYIGLVLLECSIEDNQFSSYRLPENCIEVGRGKVFLGKGFFVPNTVKQLIDESRKILSNNPDFPWIAIVTVFKTTPELIARSKTIVVAKDKIYFQSWTKFFLLKSLKIISNWAAFQKKRNALLERCPIVNMKIKLWHNFLKRHFSSLNGDLRHSFHVLQSLCVHELLHVLLVSIWFLLRNSWHVNVRCWWWSDDVILCWWHWNASSRHPTFITWAKCFLFLVERHFLALLIFGFGTLSALLWTALHLI